MLVKQNSSVNFVKYPMYMVYATSSRMIMIVLSFVKTKLVAMDTADHLRAEVSPRSGHGVRGGALRASHVLHRRRVHPPVRRPGQEL